VLPVTAGLPRDCDALIIGTAPIAKPDDQEHPMTTNTGLRTLSIDELDLVSGGVMQGPDGRGCTDPRPKGPKGPTGPFGPFGPTTGPTYPTETRDPIVA
jgi:hypothetical protein